MTAATTIAAVATAAVAARRDERQRKKRATPRGVPRADDLWIAPGARSSARDDAGDGEDDRSSDLHSAPGQTKNGLSLSTKLFR